eukprot:1145831-Pelagomonas_calceolata.AAC.2
MKNKPSLASYPHLTQAKTRHAVSLNGSSCLEGGRLQFICGEAAVGHAQHAMTHARTHTHTHLEPASSVPIMRYRKNKVKGLVPIMR